MESFFCSLKVERAYLTRYASYQEAKTDLFDLHPLLQSAPSPRRWATISPIEFERRKASSSS